MASPVILAQSNPGTPMNDLSSLTDTLAEADRRHLIHPLHHPKDHLGARIFNGRWGM